MNGFRPIYLIAKSVLLEAVRRKEIYTVVVVACVLIGMVMTFDFFEVQGISKFYHEAALRIMGTVSGLMVIYLASRQLPREFETRTIYTLLAKPINRSTFLLGKLIGVLGAALFCFGLFMIVYVLGTWYLGAQIAWPVFLQHIYLQMLQMLVLATLAFLLTLVLNLDAAMTIGFLFYALASTLMSMTSFLYYEVDQLGKAGITFLTYFIPQLSLFDLSAKTVHADVWEPLKFVTMATLTLYALIFGTIYYSLAWVIFRKKSL